MLNYISKGTNVQHKTILLLDGMKVKIIYACFKTVTMIESTENEDYST